MQQPDLTPAAIDHELGFNTVPAEGNQLTFDDAILPVAELMSLDIPERRKLLP